MTNMLPISKMAAAVQPSATLAAGAKAEKPPKNEFYGDRASTVRDPFGHGWHINTHVEDVTPEEMQKRMAAMMPAGS